MAALLIRSLRTSDMVGRWASDEFAVYLPGVLPDKGREILGKILTTFAAESFTTKERATFSASFSTGIALVDLNAPVEQAMYEADAMLYKAKSIGRSQCMA